MNIYEVCPEIDNSNYKIRFVSMEDCDDLLKVYSDKAAVRFFNSDNCNGDDFHYTTRERMEQAIDFWLFSYKNGYFVRFSIIDKKTSSAIGTFEIFKRTADDYFNDCGLLRLDISSSYENSGAINEILEMITKPIFEWFGCSMIATKAIPEAVERISALENNGFTLSSEKLIGHDGTEYDNYYVLKK